MHQCVVETDHNGVIFDIDVDLNFAELDRLLRESVRTSPDILGGVDESDVGNTAKCMESGLDGNFQAVNG